MQPLVEVIESVHVRNSVSVCVLRGSGPVNHRLWVWSLEARYLGRVCRHLFPVRKEDERVKTTKRLPPGAVLCRCCGVFVTTRRGISARDSSQAGCRTTRPLPGGLSVSGSAWCFSHRRHWRRWLKMLHPEMPRPETADLSARRRLPAAQTGLPSLIQGPCPTARTRKCSLRTSVHGTFFRQFEKKGLIPLKYFIIIKSWGAQLRITRRITAILWNFRRHICRRHESKIL